MKKTIFILTLLLPVCFLFAQNNFSDVNTDGDANAYSFVSQSGVGWNNSVVDQDGDLNTVDVTQLNDDYIYVAWWDQNNSDIVQDGISNYALVNQIHGTHLDAWLGGNLDADIDQFGNGNQAYVRQEGTWNNATIYQDGDNGVAIQHQGKSTYFTVGTVTRFNDAVIWQKPDVDGGSRAEQYQEGTQNDAVIWQNSDNGSRAVQIQVNDKAGYTWPIFTDLNVAFIHQVDGGNNHAYQVQYYTDLPGPGDAGRNDANVVQTGSGNYSQEVQLGGDNDSDVYQNGSGNGVFVIQTNNGINTDPGFVGLPITF